jgi:hypothetical protein
VVNKMTKRVNRDRKFKVIIEGFKNGKPTKNSKTIKALSKEELESKIFDFRESIAQSHYYKNGIWWSFGKYYIQHSTGNYPSIAMIPDNVLKASTFDLKEGEKYIVRVKGHVSRELSPGDYRAVVTKVNGNLAFNFFKPKGRKLLTTQYVHDVLLRDLKHASSGTAILKEYNGSL